MPSMGNPTKKRKGKVFWGVLAGVGVVLTGALAFGTNYALSNATVVNTYLDTPTSQVVKGEDDGTDTNYFTSAFETEEELSEYEQGIAEQVEAEGAVLLMNNGALPLAKGDKVSAVSHSSVDIVYGGTGSGSVDASSAPTLQQSLTDAGLEVNQTLWDFYLSEEIDGTYSRLMAGDIADDPQASKEFGVNEVPWDKVLAGAGDSFAEYGDAAIFVISRSGGEGADLPMGDNGQGLDYTSGVEGNYLELTQEEQDNLAGLKALKDEGTISKIIVLINSSNAVEVDFLNPEICGVDYGIDAALWIGDPGQVGLNAVGDILVGDINPSGSLVDTYTYDNLSSPAARNFYPLQYEGWEGYGLGTDSATGRPNYNVNNSYNVYQEGIYVGYRYYETRYEDAVMGTSNAGDYDYASTVAFPFGYGLSYTDFTFSNFQVSEGSDAFTVTVDVTNAGDVAGKKAVQVYLQSPYTEYDQQNGVEKAAIELAGYAKTGLIEPGETQTVTIDVDKTELRAYDANGAKTYILDAGDYYLTVAEGAHEALNNVLAAKGYTVADGMTAEGDAAMAWKWTNPTLDTEVFSTSAATGAEITNLFDEADPNKSSVEPGEVTWLSRSDWEGTFPTENIVLTANDALVESIKDVNYDAATYDGEYAGAEMPTLGADNGRTLAQMIGKDYDDPDWEPLLDQMTFSEMNSLITLGFHTTAEVQSVSKPKTNDENGPQGFTANVVGGGSGMAYTSEDVMAATMNDELINTMGSCIGEDVLWAGYSGLYGPGVNMHRTPYGGRNFEYYSEDPFIAGHIAAAEIQGIQSKGVYVFMKHAALNDSETYRMGQSVWINEQAAREIYLETVETAAVEGDASGVMNGFNRWGTKWCGEYGALQDGFLRGECGMEGAFITDMSAFSEYMNPMDGMLGGSDLWDNMSTAVQTTMLAEYEDDPVIVSAMREASHRILYTVANSNAMNGMGPNDTIEPVTPWWQTALYALTGVFAVLTVGAVVMCVRAPKKGVQ